MLSSDMTFCTVYDLFDKAHYVNKHPYDRADFVGGYEYASSMKLEHSLKPISELLWEGYKKWSPIYQQRGFEAGILYYINERTN